MKTLTSILLSLIAAFLIMLSFEFVNSLLFPFPEGMDLQNMEQIQSFTASLPWFAYVLVLLGWSTSSLLAGWLTVILSKSYSMVQPISISVLLTALGITNNIMLGSPIAVTIIGICVFPFFTFLGYLISVKD